MALLDELTSLLNRYSVENESDTPDFILARFIIQCLAAFNVSVAYREHWYGRGDQLTSPPPSMVVDEIEQKMTHEEDTCNCWPCRRRRGEKAGRKPEPV